MTDARLFDLNIKKILESWDPTHAVRELIANALDEQVLTGTAEVQIEQTGPVDWLIRDFGRGLRYEHFTQNENEEKLRHVGQVIGKFGVGLKDAVATLDRNGITVEVESAHGVITLAQRPKRGFEDVVTLHAAVSPARDPSFVGTAIRLNGLSPPDMEKSKGYFLKFSGEEVLDTNRIGRVLRKRGSIARIYIAGLLVAEEENFAFSYDITSLTEQMKKALNRERTNVGRTAYSERVKQMLLQSQNTEVASVLADQLVALDLGTSADEVKWKEVAVHACRILSANGRYLFVTSFQLMTNASAIDHARHDGIQIVTVPMNIHADVAGGTDIAGNPIRDLEVFQAEWNDSFKFEFVEDRLSPAERGVFGRANDIAGLVGGMPKKVRGVRVSETMRPDFMSGTDALGLWDPVSQSIVVRRDQLNSLRAFASTLLHEIAHARSGFDDVTRDFENELTELLGILASVAVGAARPPSKRNLWPFGGADR